MSKRRKPIDSKRLRVLLADNKLRQADLAWICGVSDRQVRLWLSGKVGIPQYACLLITAYDQRKLDDDWLIEHIEKPLP